MVSPSAPRRRLPFARPLAIAAALFLTYVLLGFLAGPPLVKRILTQNVAETLGRKVGVGEVRVNPLALTLELRDFTLAETDGAPIAGFRRLYVDFQLSSLFRRAWTLAEIAIDSPQLRADIAPDGRFNLAALLERLPRRERDPGARPPRILLQHIVVSGGAFTFSDRSLAAPTSATMTPIDLEVHDLSTIPDTRGDYDLNLRLPGGGTLVWRGDISLQPLASQGQISITAQKPVTIWRFLRERLDLAEPQGELDMALRYLFTYREGNTQLAVEDLKLAARGLAAATNGDRNVALSISALEAAGGRANFAASGGKPWQAKLELPKLSAAGLEYHDRTRVTPYRATMKEVAVGLTAVAGGDAGGAQVVLEDITVNVAGISAGEAGTAQPMVTLDDVALEGGRLDFGAHRLAAVRLKAEGGELNVVREKDGSLPLLKFLAPSDEGALRRGLASVAKEAKAAGAPWSVALDELQVAGLHVAAVDRSFGAPLAYDARDVRLGVRGYASDGKAPVKLDAALRLEQGGTLAASGEATTSFDRAELRVKLDRVNLKPLQPVIASRTRIALASGELSSELKLAYLLHGGRIGLRLDGSLRVDNMRINGAEGGERLLAWKSFAATGLRFGLAPDELRVAEARLDGVDAKIVIYKDRSVNIVKAIRLEAAQPAAGQAPVTTADTEVRFPVTVGRILVTGSMVDFSDESLVIPFAAHVRQLEGVIDGVSSDRASRATVRVEGRVDEYGLARAEGSLRPFNPTSFTDLAVTFRNVDMPPLSPYSATFAGRRIDAGKLSLDLRYRINDGRLAGDNRVLLEKFTLGEKVESEGALDLPLDLAVALLTDSDGKIDLAVPVTGDVNDPQFGYGQLVWQAIRTVIGNIVSAPFRALASIFGGGGETLEAIDFDPGRAALLPPEQDKLKRVADGLAKRPQIRLVAEGQAGAADRAALQQRDVANAVGARLGRAPAAPGEVPGLVNVTDAKTQRALEAVFRERNSDEALDKFAADAAKARGKEVDRVNAVLALVGRASADPAFYEALVKRLNETAKVPDEALAQLASERAQAVTTHMTTVLAVPSERASARVAKSPGKSQVKLELDLAAK